MNYEKMGDIDPGFFSLGTSPGGYEPSQATGGLDPANYSLSSPARGGGFNWGGLVTGGLNLATNLSTRLIELETAKVNAKTRAESDRIQQQINELLIKMNEDKKPSMSPALITAIAGGGALLLVLILMSRR